MGKTSLSSSTVAKILVHTVEPRLCGSKNEFYNSILRLIDKGIISRNNLPDKLFRWIFFKAGRMHDRAQELQRKLLNE